MANFSLIEEERFNVTEHRGFLHAFVEAISVILVGLYYCNSYIYLPPPQVSELGDKTFFIAAILAMRDNKVRRFRIHPVPVCVGLKTPAVIDILKR